MPLTFAALGLENWRKTGFSPVKKFQALVLNDASKSDPKERFFKRFIDDMFAATVGTELQAQQFVDWMNTLWP